MVYHSYHCASTGEKQFQEKSFSVQDSIFCPTKNLAKQLILVAQSILKLDNLGRETLEG
jgi:hypothetical protein